MRHETFAIGCAAGFGGDRTDAAAPIVETLIARGGAGAQRTIKTSLSLRAFAPCGGLMSQSWLSRFRPLCATPFAIPISFRVADPKPQLLLQEVYS
jgi:hypothetical protein